jgi:acetyl esterase/lipase
MIHGGGWRDGSKEDARMVARVALPLAARGYTVAAAGYRLAPRHRFPTQLDDVRRALGWLAAELGLAPGRVGVVGGSAGGHLAALLGAGGEACCAVGLVAPVDLTPPGYLSRVRDPGLRRDLERVLTDLIGASWEDDPEAWRRASPLHQVGPASAPFFLLHGREDGVVPIEQVERFVHALTSAGVEVETAFLDSLGHDVDRPPGIGPAVDAALERAWRFLDRHLMLESRALPTEQAEP